MNRTSKFNTLTLSALLTMTTCNQQKDIAARGVPAASAAPNATVDAFVTGFIA